MKNNLLRKLHNYPKMKYALRVMALGHSKVLDLTSEEFIEIDKSSKVLSLFSSITENYRIVLDAYKRVEDVQHKTALDHVIHSLLSYTSVLETRIALNSAMIGYFATTRYFLDSTDKLLPGLIDNAKVNDFKIFKSKVYDGNKGYKFSENFRNYIQHRGVPISNIRYNNFIENNENYETSDIVTAMSLLIDRERLEMDAKFKKGALVDMPKEIDIVQCIRSHVSGLWEVHNFIMEKFGFLATNARKTFSNQIDKFQTKIGGPIIGLSAVEASDDNKIQKTIPVFLDWDDARINALKNIGHLKNLHKRYISGKIQKA